MTILLSISVAILAGLLMTRLLKPLNLPDVTAYLIAGVLVGPYCLGALAVPGLGFTSSAAVSSLSLISEVALGFIAFSIGNEFRLNELKHTGRQACVVGIVQALVAALLGALFVGLGCGLCVREGGAVCGDDGLALSLSHKLKIKIEYVYFFFDFSVLALSLTYIPLSRMVYSLLTVVLSGQIVGLIQRIPFPEKKAN